MSQKSQTKICFITAIYGNYEATVKPYVAQTIPTDFICFTDNADIENNGWIIDTIPYHDINPCPFDDPHQHVNSLVKNRHTFNIAKYYKQQFQRIPRVSDYDCVVWVDGTIEIIYDKTSEYIMEHIYDYKMIGWHHEWRNGILRGEVFESMQAVRYNSTVYNNQEQPFQDVVKQYNDYIEEGYTDEFFKNLNISNGTQLSVLQDVRGQPLPINQLKCTPPLEECSVSNVHRCKNLEPIDPEKRAHFSPHFGVWITCFVAVLNINPMISQFLDEWYLQTLKYTTQDQIGFPYVCQKMRFVPYTLPDGEITGDCPHVGTQFYVKREHGL